VTPELLFTREFLTQLVVNYRWTENFTSLRAARVAVASATKGRCRDCQRVQAKPLELSETTYQLVVNSSAFRNDVAAIKAMLQVQTLVVQTAAGRVRY
jgi:hypothetical protein